MVKRVSVDREFVVIFTWLFLQLPLNATLYSRIVLFFMTRRRFVFCLPAGVISHTQLHNSTMTTPPSSPPSAAACSNIVPFPTPYHLRTIGFRRWSARISQPRNGLLELLLLSELQFPIQFFTALQHVKFRILL